MSTWWERTAFHRFYLFAYAALTLIPSFAVLFTAGLKHAGIVAGGIAITLIYVTRIAHWTGRHKSPGLAVVISACLLLGSTISGCVFSPQPKKPLTPAEFREWNDLWLSATTKPHNNEAAFAENLGHRGRELTSRLYKQNVEYFSNATLAQYAIVCIAWGLLRGTEMQIDVASILQDLRSRTYFFTVAASLVFVLIALSLKLVTHEMSVAVTDDALKPALTFASRILSTSLFNDQTAYPLLYGVAIEVRRSVDELSAVTVFELVMLANALLYFAFERHSTTLLTPLGDEAKTLSARFSQVILRLGWGTMNACAAFAVMLTVRRAVFVLLHWPTDIRFFL